MTQRAGGGPPVSIVIPVEGGVAQTLACLEAVARNTPGDHYQVVLVDDATTDGTSEILDALEGDVVIIRNPRVNGRVGCRNQGAASAATRYLVFLDPAGQPEPGWLEPLVEAADGDPDLGIIGGLAVAGDGTVLAAGGLVCSDGSCHVFGAGLDAEAAARAPRCEVDWIPGAPCLVRHATFWDLGGFDARLGSFGLEDVDLAFAARRRGWRVMYEPRSRTIRSRPLLDEASGVRPGGLATEAGARALLDKWRLALAMHEAPAADGGRVPVTMDRLRRLGAGAALPGRRPGRMEETPRARNAAKAREEARLGRTVLESLPSELVLSPAGTCNIRCRMCRLSHGSRPTGNWTMSDLQRFDPMLEFASRASPIGVGEPLLVPGYLDMVRHLKDRGCWVDFSTNGILLGDAVEGLLDAGVDEISVSIDAATDDAYRAIRRNGRYRDVTAAAARLVARRRERGMDKPTLVVSVAIQRENVRQLSDIVRMAHGLGADRVLMEYMAPHSPELDEVAPTAFPEVTNECLAEAAAVAHSIGIHLTRPPALPAGAPQAPAQVPSGPSFDPAHGPACRYPWTFMVAWGDMALGPCCVFGTEIDGIPFGNARQEDPRRLWNSGGFVRLRERWVSGDLPPTCVTCTFSGRWS